MYKVTGLFVLGCCLSVAGCKTLSPHTVQQVVRSSDPVSAIKNVASSRVKSYQTNPENLVTDVRDFIALVEAFQQAVGKKWGNKNNEVASKKKYVKYTDNYLSRAIVDFKGGNVRVETIATTETMQHLKKAIVTTLLTPDDPSTVDLFSVNEVTFSSKPWLYGQVQDQDKKPVAYEWRANRFADYLIANQYRTERQGLRKVHYVDIPLVTNHEALRKVKFQPLVSEAAKRYQLEEALIYAIIQTESSFNPYAVSPASAYGLMQVVPATAGRDVYQKVKQKNGQPDRQTLFNPANNIDIGSAYLYLLTTRYLVNIQNPLSREYTVISAYNGGAGNVFATFSPNRSNAVSAINKLNTSSVYQRLTTRHPRHESRRYLEKVVKAKKSWQ